MQNTKYNNVNPIFLQVVYVLPPLVAALLFAVNAMWILCIISLVLGLCFYAASRKNEISIRKILFFMIISSLALYPSLFAVWNLHIIALVLNALAILLALFLSKDELRGKMNYALISFFIILAIANIIENVISASNIKLWYCIVFHFLIAALLIVRSVLTGKKN